MQLTRTVFHPLGTCVAVVLLLALALPASAEKIDESFFVQMESDNTVVVAESGGTGWNGGEWFPYPYATGETWWNQWFYDHPPDPTRYKVMTYDIEISGEGEIPFAEVALNWSTLAFPETGPDGPPPMAEDEQFIGREIIFSGSLSWGTTMTIQGEFAIPVPYNPEWVSIDIRTAEQDEGMGMLYAQGTLTHECLPEPATMSLLALGGLAVLRRRRRK